MTHPVSIDLIKAQLCDRIDQLVMELYPNAVREGREWLVGDVFGAPGRSMSICGVGAKVGVWKDFAGTAGGDVLDLVAAGACDGVVSDAIRWAIDWLGLGGMNAEQLRRQEEKAKAARERAVAALRTEAEKKQRQGKAIWLAAEPYEASPAERYMLGRAMDLTKLPRRPRTLRYHPRLWNTETGGPLPGMVAPVNDAVSGEQLAVHRTWFQLHGDGRVTKAPLREPKMTLGPRKGGLIPLTRGESDKPLKQMPEGEWLAVSEGIENGYSVAISRPQQRIAAAIALNNIGELRLPPQCGGLFILADNDIKPDALADFERSMNMLTDRGIAFQIVRPPPGFKDFNDWLVALKRQSERTGEKLTTFQQATGG